VLASAAMENRTQTLGELAAHPAAARVFLRHKLDFCCRGGRTLTEACSQAGLDPASIEHEIADESARADDVVAWSSRSLADIATHIEAHYHAALRRDVPVLVEAARKVERVHAAKPGVPAGLAETLSMFWDEMVSHMHKEERVLFPMLRSGAQGNRVAPPISVMMAEHDEHAVSLERIRTLTNHMQAPEHACATWRALYEGLKNLETELMMHIHLENHVLFARALRG
jgi:regulator of cell morphogenesis and NO signaling